MRQKHILSTELFTGKVVPQFIKDHKLFNSPVPIQKIFPSVGLPNFNEGVKIQKSMTEIRKENGYVLNLLTVMHANITSAIAIMETKMGAMQFLVTAEKREANRALVENQNYWCCLAKEVVKGCDPTNKDVVQTGIELNNGLVELKLLNNIVNEANKKTVYGKGASLIGTYNKLRVSLMEIDIPMQDIEQVEQFKIFCKENIPNKLFEVIFSSTGQEGAWDLLSMSMRGIRSCQRWQGEYPRCLAGSILSKFVGMIYITSGAPAESHPSEDTGTGKHPAFPSLGTKMMRRCVVRYAVNADENRACIIVDKMYPEYDKDILEIFMRILKSKTKLEVLYAPELAKSNKLRHIYTPSEKIREDILHREASYQDTVLRSKDDMNVAFLNIQKEEVERDTKVLVAKLELYMANCLSDIYDGVMSVDPEIKKIVRNIRMVVSYSAFSAGLIKTIIANFRMPKSNGIYDNKTYYKKYLREFIIHRKETFANSKSYIAENASQFSSTSSNFELLASFVFSIVVKFVKQEIRKGVN
jgi:hypothetical protein